MQFVGHRQYPKTYIWKLRRTQVITEKHFQSLAIQFSGVICSDNERSQYGGLEYVPGNR